ncbi:hypothetical protein HG535_0A05980 [Zygotorulaspora mrakii]|uniref:Serine aminopeptidase S33 domain-containing protein n=1 Tax=Zygotorulaspora mrakii TaxID=42260 RepID=A0A7H9AWI3_ZYGMR|nr:uncharacterized protein HG535_0A05980 [Zygotorulaspora mrakii]QLG70656.1 hypothetical protein HG535_0A05980 [Zygotorulaspora mrakii]
MSYPGVLHQYSYQVAFEFEPVGLPNVIIVIGGLTDGLLTVAYASPLAKAVAKYGYSVVNIQMTSSYKGFGVQSLDKDVEDIKKLVDFFKAKNRGRIIIFGRSTGSQDVIHYLLRYPETVDAGIMDAPVSDREAFSSEIDPKVLARLNETASELVKDERGSQLLSPEHCKYLFGTPVNAYRWCSLLLPGGDDDYFSADLSDEFIASTFGKLGKPFLILENERDEFVPRTTDKSSLLKRWKAASDPKYWSKMSGFVKNASHLVVEKDAQNLLVDRVTRFISEFEL